jgi:hypothetical protein
MRRSTVRVGFPILVILATTGCSFAFVRGPPRGHEEMAEFTCTESKIIPNIDVAGAGLLVLAGAVFLVAGAQDEDPDANGWNFISSEEVTRWGAVSLGLSVPIGASAFVGNRRVNDCRDAKRALQERRSGAR